MKILILLALQFSIASVFAQMNMDMDKATTESKPDITAHWFINGKAVGDKMVMVKPGVPAIIEGYFTNSEDKVLKDFKRLHGKLMHMVLVKNDLSVFKHVHPYFDPITGRFQITLNINHADPDNFQTADTLIEPGMYMIMVDVEPKKIAMRMLHTHVHVMGTAEKVDLVKDPSLITPDNGIYLIKDFYPEGVAKTGFAPYRVEAQILQNIGCGGDLIEIGINLKSLNKNGTYSKEKNIERWLRSGAHLVWFSEKMMTERGEMAMLHTHSRMPNKDFSLQNPGEHDLKFSYFDKDKLNAGLQKIWVQIKVSGKVHTIPLVFDYTPVRDTPAYCN